VPQEVRLLSNPNLPPKKPPVREAMPPEQRLLVDRRNAAQYLSISQRSLDYLLSHGELHIRRIGARVLIPLSELRRYAELDHKRLTG
jgi:excisionase family DNA binding protein